MNGRHSHSRLDIIAAVKNTKTARIYYYYEYRTVTSNALYDSTITNSTNRNARDTESARANISSNR